MRDTRLFKALTSLKLTVVTLSFSLVVVFLGTMAQEPMGLKIAVDRFFKSFFIDHVAMEAAWNKTAELFGSPPNPVTPERILYDKQWPVFPGGYLLGTVLLVNLLSAYYARYKRSWKKAGILATHFGIITLLVGQLLTDVLSIESFVSMRTGDRRNFSESFDYNEIAFVSNLDGKSNRVISVPDWKLVAGKEITDPALDKLKLKVKKYWVNATPHRPRSLVDEFVSQTTENFRMKRQKAGAEEFKAFLQDQDQPKTRVALLSLIRDFRRVDRKLKGEEWLQLYQQKQGQGGDFVIRMITGQIAEFIASQKGDAPLAPKEMAFQCRRFVEALKNRPNSPEPTVLRNLTSLINDVADFCEQRDMSGFAREFAAFVEAKEMDPSEADAGMLAERYPWVEKKMESFSSDERNLPCAAVEIIDGEKSLGTYMISARMIAQKIEIGGDKTLVSLRPKRHYHNFHMSLIKLKFEKYRGTDIPKNFESRVLVEPADGGTKRVVDIYMNHPLRYDGDTFYQYQMDPEQVRQSARTSALQVVENPGWLTPYLGCLLVALGLLYQFMTHLVGFVKKRKTA